MSATSLGRAMRLAVQRDLVLAWRRWDDVAQPILFYVIVTTLFPLATTPELSQLRTIAAGIVWVAALLASMLTLETLVDESLLSPARPDLVVAPPRIRTSSARTRTALGYLAANCGGCHDGSDAITANLPPLTYAEMMRDGDAVAESLLGRPTRFQVPGVPEGESQLVDAARPEASALVARMRSRRPASQMPPLGTVVRDQEALDAIAAWVAADLAIRHEVTGVLEGAEPPRLEERQPSVGLGGSGPETDSRR